MLHQMMPVRGCWLSQSLLAPDTGGLYRCVVSVEVKCDATHAQISQPMHFGVFPAVVATG